MSIKSSAKNRIFYIFMVSPALILFILIIAGPVLYSLGLGFTNYNFRPNQIAEFVGFDQYKKMFSDPKFWISLKNNMIVVAISIFGQIPLGFALAYLLYRKYVRFQRFFQAMVFLPQVISTVIVGILWRNFFGIRGAATAFMRFVTDNPKFNFTWFLNPNTAMIPYAIACLWIYTGFYMIVFLANLQKLDPQVIEAAQIDGAGEWSIFLKIIVPSLAGVILINCILAISGSLKGFDLIFALAPNDGMGVANSNLLLPTYMYHYAFKSSKYAFGSAISTTIVFISIGLIMVARSFGKYLNRNDR